MKLDTAPQDVAVCGNFAKSEFAVGDLGFIVDLFSDKVYSHKERAVIRELSCNAHDSHVLAGTQHVPFDVHLPTILEPFFSVRDYGTGLSDRDVRTIFAGIGISTKRNSNEVIGCFGIGSLSPYALADSFTVKSYHNGTVRTYTCYRDENRCPIVALLIEDETEEKNGLEVSVSVDGEFYAFETEAEKVFQLWSGTTPNINNKQVVEKIKELNNGYIIKGENFGFTSRYGQLLAVMGNISYNIPLEMNRNNIDGYIKFAMGELEFDTARENIVVTEKTRQVIAERIKSVKEEACELVKRQIEAQPTIFKQAMECHRIDKRGVLFNFLGLLTDKYQLPSMSNGAVYYYPLYARKSIAHRLHIGSDIEYYTYKPRMENRIKTYVRENRKTVFVLTEQQIAESQVDRELLRDLDSLPKPMIKKRGSGSSCNTSFVFSNCSYFSKHSWTATEIANSQNEMVYVEINKFTPVESGLHFFKRKEAMEHLGIFPTVYGLTSAYVKSGKFKKNNWISFRDYTKRELENAVKDKKALKYDRSLADKIGAINSFVSSERLGEWEDISTKLASSGDLSPGFVIEALELIGVSVNEDNSIQEWIDRFFEDYPMLKIVDRYTILMNKEVIKKYLA
jgi:hypothetical protein